MKISKDLRKTLIDEMKFALSNMKNTTLPDEKLFFFSAVFGATHRIMNIQYDSELVFINNVVTSSYTMMQTNWAAIKQGASINTFPNDVFSTLEIHIEQLIQKIESDEETYKVIEAISNAAYSTTGNGYYLYLKRETK